MTGTLPAPAVSFGDGATDVMIQVIDALPGYIAAVLPAGVSVPESASFHDLHLITADDTGVTGRRTDAEHEPIGEPVTVPWEEISHIHIY